MTTVNAFGRQVVDYLTNKSGGSVIAGDVVVIDSSNDQAFTTNTAGGFTGGIGVAQETIANNAAGRVLRFGYASLVNVNASVTRGQFGKTHTVAKQAVGSATRTIGTFCQFLTGGTTPTASLFSVDLLGTSLSNPMTTTGDLIYSSDNSGTPQRLGGSNSGFMLTAAGAAAPSWTRPPGYELDYVAFTANVSVTATTEGTSNTVVTGSAVVYDGATAVMIEFFSPGLIPQTTAAAFISVLLYEDSTLLGIIAQARAAGSSQMITPCLVRLKRTPTNASHTYTIKALTSSGTSTVAAGTGGSGNNTAGYIRVTKA